MVNIVNAQTPSSETIAVANSYIVIAAELMVIYATLKDLSSRAIDNNVAGFLSQMQTVAIKQDGTLAATLDQSPNPANPISTTVYPTLSRPVSMNQLVQLKTILDGIVNYIEGQPVSTQIGAHAIIHAVIGQ